MESLERLYEEEKWVDILLEAVQAEEYFMPVMFDELLPLAQAMVDADEQGVRMLYPMIVIPEEVQLPIMNAVAAQTAHQWRYRAVRAEDASELVGCRHDVEATSLRRAAVDACTLHEQQCVGRKAR